MIALVIAAAVVGLALAAAVVTIAARRYESGTWLHLHYDAVSEHVHGRTPVGSVEARMSMHPDIGRCFAVRTRFRGEPERIVYTLPTLVMVTRRVDELVRENQARRGIAIRR